MSVEKLSNYEYYYLYGLFDIEKAKEMIIQRKDYINEDNFSQEVKEHCEEKTLEIINLIDMILERNTISSVEDIERILSAAIIANTQLTLYLNNIIFYDKNYKKQYRKKYKKIKIQVSKWLKIYSLLGEKNGMDIFGENHLSAFVKFTIYLLTVEFIFISIQNLSSPTSAWSTIMYVGTTAFMIAFSIGLTIHFYLYRFSMNFDKQNRLRNKHLIRIQNKKKKKYNTLNKVIGTIKDLK